MHSDELKKLFLEPKLSLKKNYGQVRISFGYCVWQSIDPFTVLCSVTRPWSTLVQTSLLFLCKSRFCDVIEFLFTQEKQ